MTAIIAAILAGFFYFAPFLINAFQSVTRPLTGFPLFLLDDALRIAEAANKFPSPYGVPLFLPAMGVLAASTTAFPSPYGVSFVSTFWQY